MASRGHNIKHKSYLLILVLMATRSITSATVFQSLPKTEQKDSKALRYLQNDLQNAFDNPIFRVTFLMLAASMGTGKYEKNECAEDEIKVDGCKKCSEYIAKDCKRCAPKDEEEYTEFYGSGGKAKENPCIKCGFLKSRRSVDGVGKSMEKAATCTDNDCQLKKLKLCRLSIIVWILIILIVLGGAGAVVFVLMKKKKDGNAAKI